MGKQEDDDDDEGFPTTGEWRYRDDTELPLDDPLTTPESEPREPRPESERDED